MWGNFRDSCTFALLLFVILLCKRSFYSAHFFFSPINSALVHYIAFQMVFLPGSKSDVGPVRRDPIWKQASPPIPRVYIPKIPSYRHRPDIEFRGRNKKSRSGWVKKVLIAPIVALVRKCYPSDDCLRCVKGTNWIVGIVGRIVRAIVAIAPLL